MLHPSYTDLMQVVNKDVEEGETKVVNSRYLSLWQHLREQDNLRWRDAAGKSKKVKKPLSIAIQEMNEGKLTIVTDNAEEEE